MSGSAAETVAPGAAAVREERGGDLTGWGTRFAVIQYRHHCGLQAMCCNGGIATATIIDRLD